MKKEKTTKRVYSFHSISSPYDFTTRIKDEVLRSKLKLEQRENGFDLQLDSNHGGRIVYRASISADENGGCFIRGEIISVPWNRQPEKKNIDKVTDRPQATDDVVFYGHHQCDDNHADNNPHQLQTAVVGVHNKLLNGSVGTQVGIKIGDGDSQYAIESKQITGNKKRPVEMWFGKSVTVGIAHDLLLADLHVAEQCFGECLQS